VSRRALFVFATVVATVAAIASATAGAAGPVSLGVTPIGRLPFPERGYVVDLPNAASIGRDQVRVTENGVGVGDFSFQALSSTGLRYGVLLAVDTSDSMRGAPIAAARKAAATFLDHRSANESIGVVTFNGRVRIAQAPTLDSSQVRRAVQGLQQLSYGTRIYDALDRSLDQLAGGKFTTSSIVLLSDGTDVGSTASVAKVVARAKQQHVRVFTVGLRSGDFDGSTLRRIARETGGVYAESSATAKLSQVYAALSSKLSGEYLVQYRSIAAPKASVDVVISIDGVGAARQSYTAPTPAGLPPYHRSFASRFFLSGASLVLIALIASGLGFFVVLSALEAVRSKVVQRVLAFVPGDGTRPARAHDIARRIRRPKKPEPQLFRRSRTKFAEQLEIGRVSMSASTIIGITATATVLGLVILASAVSPVVAILALGTPLITRAFVKRKVNKVRNEFAEQLPPNLQVLASALRAGHSFTGALRSCVEHAHEPSKSELGRAITDEQLGLAIDDAIRKVAARMASRDLEQVALLAELQRTTGGNAAEILDVVVDTIRERADIRRLVRTLTAQGRLARLILTLLPIGTGLAFWALQPDLFGPFVRSGGGQAAFVVAAVLLALGSLSIQKIIEIEV
jgi:tight adherence protein B